LRRPSCRGCCSCVYVVVRALGGQVDQHGGWNIGVLQPTLRCIEFLQLVWSKPLVLMLQLLLGVDLSRDIAVHDLFSRLVDDVLNERVLDGCCSLTTLFLAHRAHDTVTELTSLPFCERYQDALSDCLDFLRRGWCGLTRVVQVRWIGRAGTVSG